MTAVQFFGQNKIHIGQLFAAIVSWHSSLEPRSKSDRWSDDGSELNEDQCLNHFGATQIPAELGSNSNMNRVQS